MNEDVPDPFLPSSTKSRQGSRWSSRFSASVSRSGTAIRVTRSPSPAAASSTLILKRIRRESDVRHLRLRGTSVSFLQIVMWDGERSWWRRRGRLQAAGAERGALRRRADLGGQRGTERGGGLSARSPGAATTSGSIRASRLEVRASLRQLEPRRPRLAAAVPGPTCRGREGGCGPAGHAWPPPCLAPLAGEGREGERPRRAARPLPAQC